MASNVPAKIGKYDVLGVIGRGGMGIVYRAIDPRLDRHVAIKMMTGGFVDDPDLRKRFFREAQSLASLQHPNIVTVYDLGDHEGNPYLVMQFLEGETLDVAMANHRKLSFLEKFNIIIQVCNGLAYAHQRFVVHRDIKPANIMLEKDGGVKIFDFGIAHVGDQSVTKTGQLVGTPPYMSPEQVNGKTVDARSDLFSIGVVLYQLFTDHLPFQGDSPAGTFLKILYEPPPPLSTYLTSYPPELDGILSRALAKDAGERYHSADEFALDLGQVVSQFRQEVVGRQMREVEASLAKSEFQKARELLLQVLKVDPQHVPATQALRDVERRIKKHEISEQVRKLRLQADEAAAQRQLENAQSYLEQALALDNTDPELRQHAESVRGAIAQARKFRDVLKSAESAHHEGDFDSAKKAVEEALQLSPNDTQAKALHRVIQREWSERSRLRQIDNYLFQARQDISSRKFAAALETLKLAEALDPGSPQIQSMIESATSGLEQERRRKDIEACVREIESALNRDDYRGACEKADEALARFPEERTILKLKSLAERQQQVEERRHVVEEQLALARKLMQVNRNEELLSSLEATIAKIGPEPRLQSLLAIVTENVQRERLERRKSDYIQKARELLRNQEYDSAIRTLESARAELNNEPELDDLLQFVKEEAAAEERRHQAEAAIEKAQAQVLGQNYEEAIRILEGALRDNPEPELRIALSETRRSAAEYQERIDSTLASANKLFQARKFTEVVSLLEAQPPVYLHHPALGKLLESARSQAERMRRIRDAVDQSQRIADDGDYSGARRVLEEWRRRNGSAPEIDAQDSSIEERRIASVRRSSERIIGDARILITGGDYQAALDKLQSMSPSLPDLSEAMASEYRTLQQMGKTGLVESRKSQIEDSVDRGELTRAGNLVRDAMVQFPGERDLSKLGKVVEGETSRRSAAQEKLEQAQIAFDEDRWGAGSALLAEAYLSSDHAPAVRTRVIDAFVQAAFVAVETDWRAAEALLKQLTELKPDYDPPSLLRLQIREHEREEAVGRHLGHAKALVAMGKLQEALNKLSEGLESYPDNISLLEFRKSVLERVRQEEERARQERARLERETFLKDAISRADREPSLERRIAIIDEALLRFPDEPQLREQLGTIRTLLQRVTATIAEAEASEKAGKYDEALAQWNAAKNLHRLQPELESNIARVNRLRDQARAKVKSEWVEKIRREITASEFERAQTLLREAGQQFPRDQDLASLESQIGDAVKLRGKAEKFLNDAGKAFERTRWAKGIEALDRAMETARNDAVIQSRCVDQLLKASDSVLAADTPNAKVLLARAALLAPSAAAVSALDRKIKDREREQAIAEHLNAVRRAQQGGDLEGARQELDRALKAYPEEQRFVQAKVDVERQLQQLQERQAQERERARQLELERERERERKRQEEVEREQARQRAREQEEEVKKEESARRERIRAEEAERRRVEDEKRERERAEKAEQERKEAAERERLRAEEAERKRIEDEKRDRARAEQAERERKEAEKRRLEEQRRLQEEAAQKEEQARKERELARKREQEQKEQEKSRKREAREKKEAEAAKKKKQEEESRLREDERRKQELQEKQKKKPQLPVPPEPNDMWATRAMHTPLPGTSKAAKAGERVQGSMADAKVQPAAKLGSSTRYALFGGIGVAVLVGALVLWRLFSSHSVPVQITTTPDGATVTITAPDQPKFKRDCVTPSCNLDLKPGTYSLQVRHDGFETYTQTIELAGNGTNAFPVTLVPSPALSGGGNTVASTPSPEKLVDLQVRGLKDGSELSVDGKSIGRIGRKGEITVQLPAGSHQIQALAKNQNSNILIRNFIAGRVVSLGRDDFYPPTPPAPEDVDWQKLLGSNPNISAIEEFLRKYPGGTHRSEAEGKLEDLYWHKDSQGNSVDAYREYLGHFSGGPHAATAEEEMAFLTARTQKDPSSLDAFIAKYPTSRHRAEIDGLRDDLAWQRVKDDESSLTAYLHSFPNGKHAGEAQGRLGEVRDEWLWQHTNRNDEGSLNAYLKAFPDGRHSEVASDLIAKIHTAASPPVTKPPVKSSKEVDEAAIRTVLNRYEQAYASRNVDALQSIWPNMGSKRYKDTKNLFAVVSAFVMKVDVQDIEFAGSGDGATVTTIQSQTVTIKGQGSKQGRDSAIFEMTKLNGNWVISNLR